MSERRKSMIPWIALAGVLTVAGLFIMFAGRQTLFRGDDWDLLYGRLGSSGADVYLSPHVDHLVATQVVAYKGLASLFGPQYAAFRAALLVVHLTLGVTLFIFIKRRLGPWLALIMVSLLLFMGAGSDNLIWPTQLSTVLSLPAGIGALLLLEDTGTWRRVAATGLLVIAAASGTYGLFFIIAAAIWGLLERGRRRDLWVPAIPAILYLAWNSRYGESSVQSSNVVEVARFTFDLLAGGAAGLLGFPSQLGHPGGWAEGVTALVLVLLIIGLSISPPRLTPRLVAICTLPLAASLAVALGRANGGDAFATRYALPTAVLILMALAEAFNGRRLSARWMKSLGVATVICVGLGAAILEKAGNDLRSQSQDIRARLTAMELARKYVRPDFIVGPLGETGNLTAKAYFAGNEEFGGSPIGEPDPESLGPYIAVVDEESALAMRAHISLPGRARPVVRARPSIVSATVYGRQAGCVVVAGDPPAVIEVPRSGLVVSATSSGARVAMSLIRFGEIPPPTFAGIGPKPRTLTIPSDDLPERWKVFLSGGDARVCRFAGK